MFSHVHVWSFYLLQGGAIGWDVRSLINQMGTLAKLVVFLLFLMSAYSIGVMIDRLLAYSAARKQSRQFAPAVAGPAIEASPGVTAVPEPGTIVLLLAAVWSAVACRRFSKRR